MTNPLAVLAEFKEASDETALTEMILGLAADEVPALALRVTEARKMLDRIEDVCEAAMERDRLKEWSHEGTRYVFSSVNKRTVKDIDGLRAALDASGGVSVADQKQIFVTKTEVKFTRLNELADRDDTIREIRDEFTTWQRGPKHLRLADEERRSG